MCDAVPTSVLETGAATTEWQEMDMPFIEIKLFESRVEDDEVAARIVRAVTDGLCSVIGQAAREQTWVVVEGVSPKRWGFGGEVKQ